MVKKARVLKGPRQKAPADKTSEPLAGEAVSREERGFRIVGIGASAGGLEALERFFGNMPSDRGMAFVIVQHLDPTGHSSMPEILSRFTKMKIEVASDGLKGQEIPLGSRIICIADAYDTMVTPRSYGKVMSQNKTLIELERCSGTQFDPEIIKVVSQAVQKAFYKLVKTSSLSRL